jgi:2-oxoisovalerate dehydrogenase E2 component (dihydrolipoyl transacylase)
MAVEVKLPQLGESTYEGTIVKWLKRPGDRVERFEPLVEIMTDKVNVEMPSPYGGVLTKVLIAEGQTVAVGTPIAFMETTEVPAEVGSVGTPAAASIGGPVQQAPVAAERGVRLSPVVRNLDAEHGVSEEEVATIPGTGAGGRITKEDLLAHLQRRGAVSPGATPTPPPSGDQVLKLSPLRRSIAQRMAQSKREIPHAYGVIEVDLSNLVRERDAYKDAWRTREGVNITYTAFFLRAAVEAVKAFPIVNSSWAGDGILLHKAVNLGIGIALKDGLIVAVIKAADQERLVGLAQRVETLSARAREGKLTLDDVQGGTLTLTNPGVFGSIWSLPIIVPGQAAIIATDAIVKRPVVRDGAVVVRDIMHLGLAFDHRIFDGAIADQFLHRMRQKLESVSGGARAVGDF